ncbi:hypothetical protein QEN19_002843 [Hanseniaspora menglaensis]
MSFEECANFELTVSNNTESAEYLPAVTYEDENKSYGFEYAASCVCKTCTFICTKNFKELFFYGILCPILWFYPGIVYIWQFIIYPQKFEIDLEKSHLTDYQLNEYAKNNFSVFKLEIDDFNYVNSLTSYQHLAMMSKSHSKSHELTNNNYKFIYKKKFIDTAYERHENLKSHLKIWTFRSLTGVFTYLMLGLMGSVALRNSI